MKIEKLPSGSYRIRQQYNGKRYTITVNYKPTQKEALMLMTKKMNQVDILDDHPESKETYEYYVDQYISYCESKEVNLSPSTIRGYSSMKKNTSDEFKSLRLSDITNKDIQKEIDRYAENHSAKSTKNLYGLIRSVLSKYRKDFQLIVNLPTSEKKSEYEPTTKDIQAIIEVSRGTKYYIALQLGVLGLRRGEIMAITDSDLDDDNVLTINKDMVLNKDNQYVVKNCAKTEASNRRILLPDELAKELRAQKYAFKGNPHTLNQYLHRTQDKLKIPRFRFHMLRHFCVAYLHKKGFTAEQIMAWGGWSSDYVMKRAYRYNLDPAESQLQMANTLSEIF